jgi:hypothetical protein
MLWRNVIAELRDVEVVRDSGEMVRPEGSSASGARIAVPEELTVDGVRPLLDSFVEWLDRFGERSYDPHDFWAWLPGRKAKRLYYRRPSAGALPVLPFVALDTFLPSSRRLVASQRRYPIADAHYAAGFFHLATLTADPQSVARGVHFLEELERSRCEGFDEFCWGYPFDWESRSGTIVAGTPLITSVPYAYEAFELGYQATNRPQYLRVMESIAAFAFDAIPVTEFEDGSAAAGYTPFARTTVVNASCYRGFLLAAAGRRFGRADWMREAERNIAFAIVNQRPDGSWPYATVRGEHFVDNFHTCLVLKNLFKFWRLTGRGEVLDSISRGFAFYRRNLLDERQQPIPFAVKPRLTLHSGDLYDYAEGINLSVHLREVELDAVNVLQGMLRGLVNEWALGDGHFVTRRLIVGRNTIPYHRWGQSQVFHALAYYCRSLN